MQQSQKLYVMYRIGSQNNIFLVRSLNSVICMKFDFFTCNLNCFQFSSYQPLQKKLLFGHFSFFSGYCLMKISYISRIYTFQTPNFSLLIHIWLWIPAMTVLVTIIHHPSKNFWFPTLLFLILKPLLKLIVSFTGHSFERSLK